MAVRAIITAMAVVLSTPALGWDVLSPPQWAYRAGLERQQHGEVTVNNRSPAFIQTLCAGSGYALGIGQRFYACSIVTEAACIVWMSDDLPPAIYEQTLAHELGHCGGWVH